MKEVFKHVVSIPFLAMLVAEKIGREIGRKFLRLDLKGPPGAPNELGVVEDVVSGGGLKGFDASVLLRLGSSKTPDVCVTKSDQSGGGTVMGWPLEL